MKRRLFTLACAISFLLCVATAALWCRSLSYRDTLDMWTVRHELEGSITVASQIGYFDVGTFTSSQRPSVWPPRTILYSWWQISGENSSSDWEYFLPPKSSTTMVHFAGVWWSDRVSGNLSDRWMRQQMLRIHYWIPTTLFMVLPLLWLLKRLIQRRRKASNLCVTCGYDLRATPNRCPECGLVPEATFSLSPAGRGQG
jgi:hypothetical protein